MTGSSSSSSSSSVGRTEKAMKSRRSCSLMSSEMAESSLMYFRGGIIISIIKLHWYG
jgi:hypothetical protein